MNPNHQSQLEQQDKILTKATLRLAEFLNLSGKDLSETLGISEASITRLHQGKKTISAQQ